MDNDSKQRPHKRPGKVISGHWRDEAREQLRTQIQHGEQSAQDLETRVRIARSTVADQENHDGPGASARLLAAAQQLSRLAGKARNAQGEALHRADSFAHAHPLLLAAGGIAIGFGIARLLARRDQRRAAQTDDLPEGAPQ
ncbi:hypothetical protein [Phytopseudomonas dryadis]|uniref:DUF883 domain-containing protein n=1 Tax=Phytopseudomonas dryadis TaxID=2487520 RepID=A0A4Q9R2W2_9GAMM|nr:hypothetical protein [Pseudomonas dryadis]TBU93976.1 hypothetical protein DNK44_09890 [Pseudomonas dryadis]